MTPGQLFPYERIIPGQKQKFNMSPREKGAKAEIVRMFLVCVKEYKSSEEFEYADFKADLVLFYEKIRTIMAASFEDLGPIKLSESLLPLNDLSESHLQKFNDKIKLERIDMKKGYDRVKEKVKALRQDYRLAVNSGTRFGSG